MKTSVVIRNGVTPQVIELIGRLIGMIPWPSRRSAMGDVVISLLDGKSRVSEDVFGWSRNTVELGMNEFRTKIVCVNDLSKAGFARNPNRRYLNRPQHLSIYLPSKYIICISNPCTNQDRCWAGC